MSTTTGRIQPNTVQIKRRLALLQAVRANGVHEPEDIHARLLGAEAALEWALGKPPARNGRAALTDWLMSSADAIRARHDALKKPCGCAVCALKATDFIP